MRRVVITGAGTINPLGADIAATQAAMRAGQGAIAPLNVTDVDRLSIKIGASVQGFDPNDHFSAKSLPLYDRFTQFALVAARQAMQQSAPELSEQEALSAGVIIGSSGAGLTTQDETYRAVFEGGKNRVHPFTVPRLMMSAPAAHISMEFGLRGPCFALSSACASSNHAMIQALNMIRAGQADVMLTGGADAMLCFGGIKAWEGLRVLSPDGCRPFDEARNGMVMGEGAAVFVFESYERAKARGAVILAEVAGGCMTSDASDIVMPDQASAARAISGALKDAGLAPQDVGYINAHGTGTAANDRVESAALRQSFGAAADEVLVSSTKAMHGHAIGAAGAIELIACLMALNEGVIAPTINFETSDPACDLDIVPNEARAQRVTAVLSNAFAFGGLNAVLALRNAV
ncbi:MAG: beta-ketoacyl-[acyl-carrier-protein] synthase family protein [Maritimibacter sp.]